MVGTCLMTAQAAAGQASGPGGTRTAKEGRPNILLIVSEDNGPELGCYGDRMARTPHLDALAAAGTRFDRAFTTYSLCSPSRGSILTGLYPHQNGQVGLATHRYTLYSGIRTLPAYLKDAGYRSCILGKKHVNPEADIPFERWQIRSDNFQRRDLDGYIRESEAFMRAGEDPFLLMVNFPDAHFPLLRQVEGLPVSPRSGTEMQGTLPFIGASSPRLREYVADYHNALERLDVLCGRLLKALEHSGKAGNTVILYLGDHGAQFSRGKQSSYEAGLRIPMLLYDPRLRRQQASTDALVSVIDILPTFLDIAGRPTPRHLPGRSLLPLLERGRAIPTRTYLFSASDGGAPVMFHPMRTVRNDRYKLIHNLLPARGNPDAQLYASHYNSHFDGGTEDAELTGATAKVRQAYALWRHPPEYELYDLRRDPQEWHDRSADPALAHVLAELQAALRSWQRETRDPLADTALLGAYAREVDEVRQRYPDDGYRKAKDFEWRFTRRFQDYVWGADGPPAAGRDNGNAYPKSDRPGNTPTRSADIR
jgi:N-sulfoglucosamine sulfohydrolase